MNQLSYRNLVGVTHTEEEAKQIAAEVRPLSLDYVSVQNVGNTV